MTERNSFTYKLAPEQQAVLTDILRNGNYRPAKVEHTSIAATTPDCCINLYKSGKCLIQGKGAADFVTFVMEPMVLQSAALGYEDVIHPEGVEPHIGIDESGKGDFFGPLVIAGAYVDKPLAEEMRRMNVRDSKTITSDSKAMDMGAELRKLLGNRFTVIKIGPTAYNRLYLQMRSVNTILAWGHARAIENMLSVLPDCPRAISDQFGSKQQVEKALMKKGKAIILEQRHRAESDLAVAAASIIARENFLRSLKEMESKYGIKIPKGASDLVKDAGVSLIQKNKPEILLDTAKCHFRTTDEVLKRAGSTRADLGKTGSAVSKIMTNPNWRKKSSSTPATAAQQSLPGLDS